MRRCGRASQAGSLRAKLRNNNWVQGHGGGMQDPRASGPRDATSRPCTLPVVVPRAHSSGLAGALPDLRLEPNRTILNETYPRPLSPRLFWAGSGAEGRRLRDGLDTAAECNGLRVQGRRSPTYSGVRRATRLQPRARKRDASRCAGSLKSSAKGERVSFASTQIAEDRSV